ncbi:uncharacterized protein NPIL_274962 [Nephila pilipes]|uniref:Uncharacterized protein n=1 Tax=Nephila pilipes TaxID=299642 RepID=A0A8X6Q3A2_NEPPI|nr:uncharacterized protein NPIL_274962 [Nephila pilipes]
MSWGYTEIPKGPWGTLLLLKGASPEDGKGLDLQVSQLTFDSKARWIDSSRELIMMLMKRKNHLPVISRFYDGIVESENSNHYSSVAEIFKPVRWERILDVPRKFLKLFNELFSNAIQNKGVLAGETENNNAKWTLTAMEKYMRDQSEASVALGLVSQPPTSYNKRKTATVPSQQHQQMTHTPNGDAQESAGEETSPSWASSSTGNTPSFGSSGVAFEFNEENEKGTPIITTTTCTPHSTPENKGHRKSSGAIVTLSSSTELLEALDSGLELSLSKPRKSRKDSDSSMKGNSKTSSGSHGGTPTKTSKLSKLLRRTHSAGCSKDVSTPTLFMKEKADAACDPYSGPSVLNNVIMTSMVTLELRKRHG